MVGLNRNDWAVILLYLSWPACLIHRLWNGKPVKAVNWFVFPVYDREGKEFTQDVQWYIYETGNMVSWFLILLSFCILKNKTPAYRIVLYAITLIQLIDIVHYWLWYKQNETIVMLESLIMVTTSILLIYLKWKKD